MKRSDVKREVSKMSKKNKRRDNKATRKEKVADKSCSRGDVKADKFKEGDAHKLPNLLPKTENQEVGLDLLRNKPLVVLSGNAGCGKAQPLTSKILTPSGWKYMKEITAGSKVICPDGTYSEVLEIHPQGVKDIYNVTFEDGRSAECCEDHLWDVYLYDRKTKWQVTPLRTIIDDLKMKSKKDRMYVALPEPTEVSITSELKIDPYLLGVLLGDGGLTGGSVSLTSSFSELVEKVRGRLPEGMYLSAPKDGRITYNLRTPSGQINPLRRELDALGLVGKLSYFKFIPEEYITNASINNRWELLQGLMDTDGTVENNGGVTYSTSSVQLALDVQKLVRSLGGLCKIHEKYPTYTYKDEKKEGATNYNLTIRLKELKKIFTLSNKADKLPDKNQYSDNLRLRIKAVELVKKEEAQCIAIDHPKHLYITDDYIVTHNTYLSCWWAAKQYLEGKVDRIIITRPNEINGRDGGATPGTDLEKLQQMLAPMLENLSDFLGRSKFEALVGDDPIYSTITVAPLEKIAGRSFREGTIVIADELQMSKISQMRSLTTRMEEGSQLILLGDPKQAIHKGDNGLSYIVNTISKNPLELDEYAGVVQFTKDDCVRGGLAGAMVRIFDEQGAIW